MQVHFSQRIRWKYTMAAMLKSPVFQFCRCEESSDRHHRYCKEKQANISTRGTYGTCHIVIWNWRICCLRHKKRIKNDSGKGKFKKQKPNIKKAVDDFLNSGKLTTTTYVNGREFNHPTAKDDVEAVFIAEYAKSPRTAEQPWSQKWTEQYGIQDSSCLSAICGCRWIFGRSRFGESAFDPHRGTA